MEENRNINETVPVKKQRSLWDEAWRRFKKNKTAMGGLIYLSILVVVAISTTVIDWVTKNQVYKQYIIKQGRFFSVPSAERTESECVSYP